MRKGSWIHWFGYECGHVEDQDNFTNTPSLVTCPHCEKYLKQIEKKAGVDKENTKPDNLDILW